MHQTYVVWSGKENTRLCGTCRCRRAPCSASVLEACAHASECGSKPCGGAFVRSHACDRMSHSVSHEGWSLTGLLNRRFPPWGQSLVCFAILNDACKQLMSVILTHLTVRIALSRNCESPIQHIYQGQQMSHCLASSVTTRPRELNHYCSPKNGSTCQGSITISISRPARLVQNAL